MVAPVNPQAGLTAVVSVGGTAVDVVPVGPTGGFILNPYTAEDQGLSVAEDLYIDPVAAPGLDGNGTTTALGPGQVWQIIPGQTTITRANATSSGHKFTVVWY